MSHFNQQRWSLATELTRFQLENKTQALVVINGLMPSKAEIKQRES